MNLEELQEELERARPTLSVEVYEKLRTALDALSYLQELVADQDMTMAELRRLVVVRGGTDGSRLTELGLPTPNLFCGEHNAHGPLEWVAVQDMESAVTACAHLAALWERKG